MADTRAPLQPRATGLVLAGGRSKRFGSDKLALDVDGTPLLHRAVLAVAGSCTEVLVAISATGAAPALPRAAVPLRLVRDALPDAGPLAGLVAGLDAASEALVLVVAGDMPSLPDDLLTGLLERAMPPIASPGHAIVLADGEGWRPLPCVLLRDAALPLANELVLTEERSLRGLLRLLEPDVIAQATWRRWDPDGEWRRDIDEPADLSVR
ncbi:MAG: molybdenum cofactor guanylyltransferase [Candidatus Limnocylindrales bacterium]